MCLSCRWKPRISIRGSTPSGLRKKRKHANGFRICAATLFVSGHGFNRAVTAAKSTRLQPLRAWLFSCHADSSAPALRPVAQPFLAVRLWSAGNPLTASFATSFTNPPSHWVRLGLCSVRLCLCSSPLPVLTGARESTFPQRSPITQASLASHVWGRGRIRRSTPLWRATSR